MSSILLFPLKLVFYTAVVIKNWCYDAGICSQRALDIPVISIGNIAFGGTGKTPMVIHLCEKLKEQGYTPAVISRGYKRKSNGLIVVHDGNSIVSNVNDAGDEPYLIARKLNMPVVVADEKVQAAEYVADNFKDVNAIVMDDGFQYRKLGRSFDIVLLNGSECSGLLREPKSSLKRADLVLTLDKQYSISEFADNNFNQITLDESVYAFCGIANPDSFIQFLQSENIDIAGESIFADHHDYSKQSLKELENSIKDSGANSIITTEKDLVKLSEDFLTQYKVYIVTVSIVFEDDTFYNQIFKGIKNS